MAELPRIDRIVLLLAGAAVVAIALAAAALGAPSERPQPLQSEHPGRWYGLLERRADVLRLAPSGLPGQLPPPGSGGPRGPILMPYTM
jgi:hypothetical protein